jgi:hypothetical protein
MGNECGMIFIPMMGNYTLDIPSSFTGKIPWDLIGNINWDETLSNRLVGWHSHPTHPTLSP